jgi:polyisoprenoid-binding protein YceI
MHRSRIIVADSVLAVLAVLWVLSPPLAAETLTFTLDPQATTIEFGFGATLHSVEGSLRAKEGKIDFDPETGQASGRIVLDATSAKTGNSRRDAKMHVKILESPKYPEMIYTVERISGTLNRAGRSDIELHGTLDMHGVQRPLDLVGTAKADGDRITAIGRVTIPYLEWGMLDPSFFILRVEKQVHVEVKASGHLSGGSVQ